MFTYPVNLILDRRKCLIVGGGKVASRKLGRLMESGALITVITPKASQTIESAAETGKICLIKKEFRPEDLIGFYLVFAATADSELNRQIIQTAGQQGIICCAVDENWSDGSFITPASMTSGDITLAISSQGTACRKSRLIKDNLARHITCIENAELTVIGTDHEHLPLSDREPLHLVDERLEKAGAMISQIWGIQGFVLLNTCNRVELIAAAHTDDGVIDMLKMVLGLNSLKENQYYIKSGFEAFSHLCLTVAGLKSQTPGEKHIAGQFKKAFELAEQREWAGALIQSLHDNVLRVSRLIRNATSPLLHGIDIEELAVDYAKSLPPSFSELKCAVLGTGETGTGLVRLLKQHNVKATCFYRSNIPDQVADSADFKSLTELKEYIHNFDLIYCALGGNEPYLTEKFKPLLKSGAYIIDLGIPRNVSLESERIHICNMEDLKHWHRRANCDLEQVIATAEKVIEEQREVYERFRKSYIDGRQGQ